RGISFSFQQCNQCGYWFRFLTRGIIPAMKEFGENPLGPFIIVRVRSLDGSIPIVVKTDIIELFFIAGNVFFCSYRRVLTCFDSILFCWQSNRIKALRVQHMMPLHLLVTCVYICSNISQRVSYMQAGTTRVRKHV